MVVCGHQARVPERNEMRKISLVVVAMELAFFPSNQLATNNFAMPHVPGEWHFADAIEYSLTLNQAVLDYASRNRSTLLFNRWRMGMNAIEAGNKDSWTIRPRMVEDIENQIRAAGG